MRRREFKALHARKIRADHISHKLLRATSTETPRPAHAHLALQRDAPPRKASIHRRDTLHHLAVYKLKNENGAQSNDPSRNDTLTGDTGAGRDLPKGQSTLKKSQKLLYYSTKYKVLFSKIPLDSGWREFARHSLSSCGNSRKIARKVPQRATERAALSKRRDNAAHRAPCIRDLQICA